MQCPKKYLKDDWMISIYLQNLFNKFSPIFIHVHAHNKQKSSRLSNNLLIFYHYLYLYLNKKVACYLECSNLGPNPRSKFPCMAFKSALHHLGQKDHQ